VLSPDALSITTIDYRKEYPMDENRFSTTTFDSDLLGVGTADGTATQTPRTGLLRTVVSVLAMTAFFVVAVVCTLGWALVTVVVSLLRRRRGSRLRISAPHLPAPSPTRDH
jgi:hypothetical protein